MRRIRTVDGWRGVAILMVLTDHVVQASQARTPLIFHLGTLGVDIFFVISGYVITLSLLREEERSGGISLRDFYWRRVFRILPVATLYLLVLFASSRFVYALRPVHHEILSSLFFWRNYWQVWHQGLGLYTSHYWSLSVEEHFYLLWPALLWWSGRRRAVPVAIAGVLGVAFWRYLHYLRGAEPIMVIRTDLRLDGLLLGCLLALLLSREPVREFVLRNFPKETPILCGFPLLLWFRHMGTQPSLLTYVLIACALTSTLVVEEGLVHRWLNSRVLVWVGTISYSLYIWQQLFTRHPEPGESPIGWAGRLPVSVVLTIAVAAASYYWYERPIQRWAKRLAARRGTAEDIPEAAVRTT